MTNLKIAAEYATDRENELTEVNARLNKKVEELENKILVLNNERQAMYDDRASKNNRETYL